MSVSFFGTNNFLNNIKQLCKKKKDNYYTVSKDISTEYQNIKDIDETIMKGMPISEINEQDKKIILKTRYKNNAMGEGKSGGYRSYSIADKEDKSLTFLAIYPKKGKFSKVDLNKTEITNILNEYIEQKQNNSITELDIKNNLLPKQ